VPLMINTQELEAMSQQNIESSSREQLKSLSDVQLESDAPQVEKILSFIEQISNPYCFLSGKTPVKVCFTENGKKINEAIESILQHMRQA